MANLKNMILCIIWLIATVSRKHLLSDINSFNQILFTENAGIQATAWQEPVQEPVQKFQTKFFNPVQEFQLKKEILIVAYPYGYIWETPPPTPPPPPGSGLEATVAYKPFPKVLIISTGGSVWQSFR